MELQFTEHNEGKKSTNPKVQKLDKLARLLKVEISIDGVKYGNIDETGPNKMVTPKEVVEKYTNTNINEKTSEDNEYNIDTDAETGIGTGTDVETHADDSDIQSKTKSSTKKRGRPKKTT